MHSVVYFPSLIWKQTHQKYKYCATHAAIGSGKSGVLLNSLHELRVFHSLHPKTLNIFVVAKLNLCAVVE